MSFECVCVCVCFCTLHFIFFKDDPKTEICVMGILSCIVEVVCLGEGSRGLGVEVSWKV